jgi:hypothetical protein
MVDIFEKNNAELKFLNRPNCASPELRLARIVPREYAVLFAALKRSE